MKKIVVTEQWVDFLNEFTNSIIEVEDTISDMEISPFLHWYASLIRKHNTNTCYPKSEIIEKPLYNYYKQPIKFIFEHCIFKCGNNVNPDSLDCFEGSILDERDKVLLRISYNAINE